jgi:SAM-dependent methyltransferase
MLIYATTIFLSAFLLFQVQPMIAKMILPWFGGSTAVWVTCMLFFQVGLLAGYVYAHASIRYLRPRVQSRVHALLLVASLLALPLGPAAQWKPTGAEDPAWHIVCLLAVSVGLPYLLLSATTPLIQAWYAGRFRSALPYRLFALSNLASLLGLLAYPFLIEPRLSLAEQSLGWSIAYGVFAGMAGLVAMLSSGPSDSAAQAPVASEDTARPGDAAPGIADTLAWLFLSCGGVVLLLAVTNHLTQNITSIPFLWILPLSLYLLSFMLCFNTDGVYIRPIYLGPVALVLLLLMYSTLRYDSTTQLALVIGVFSFGLFACCMFCHGELAQRKPSPRHLTRFYLMIALGGALGGVLVGVAAPMLLRGYVEMPLALSACAVMLLLAQRREVWQSRLSAALLCAVMFGGTGVYLWQYTTAVVAMERNFYGCLRVKVTSAGTEFESRALVHGTVVHGVQFTDAERRREPTAYYGPASGAALVLQALHHRPIRVGLVGLGVGTLAAYSRPGDVYRFYEINPLVEKLARQEFTFLADAGAAVDVIPGDARLALEREPDQQYDVLIIDAFSGDAIPVHLLTREAMELYWRHLTPPGILALHLTNNHLDLISAAERLALALGKHAVWVESDLDEAQEVYNADWVLITSDPLEIPAIAQASKELRWRPGLRVWTDDYSNLFEILKR